MLWHKKYLRYCMFTVMVFMQFFSAHAQSLIKAKDTAVITVQDTIESNIVNKVEKYTFTLKQTSGNINRTVKLAPIFSAVVPVQTTVNAIQKIIDSSARFMNLRRLNTFDIMLREFGDELSDYKTTLTDYGQQLRSSNDTVVRITKDTSLDVFVLDSGLEKQIKDIRRRAVRMDSAQSIKLARIMVVRNKVSLSLLQVRDMISTISMRTKSLKRKMWKAEDLPLFKDEVRPDDQSIFKLFGNSLSKMLLVTNIYLSQQWSLLTVAVVVFLFIIIWTWSNMYRAKRLREAKDVLAQMFFLRPGTVVICGLLVFFICLPFFFGDPPMSVVHICEICRTLLVTWLLYPYLVRPVKKLWILFCVLWLFYVLDDLLLDSAISERWALLITGILYSWLCVRILLHKDAFFTRISESRIMKVLVLFCLIQMLLSVFFNITGRITLTKIMGVSAVECLMLGVTLKVFCSIVLEAIYLQSEAYRQSRLSEYINYKELENKFKRILWVVAIIIWLATLIRNWGMYDNAMQMVTFFFVKQRSLSNHHFSFGGIAVFIGIIWVSVIISRFINFFFGQETNTVTGKRNNMASMMLLIRIAIWAVGFLIAVVAAGIPLTQLTVMLGALSVGIGFGLQNIANNLVSGIILAFERPIQVGDQIEIGGKSGTVKEIGVRSSKLSSGSGADIIIPNGDLLSQQLTNWTMKDLTKSVEFKIGVTYDSDLLKIKQIIIAALEKEENVLKSPAPSVLLQNFADEALEIKVSFWVTNLSSAGSIRSAVMINVYEALQENGIKLPYPIIRPAEKKKDSME